MRSDDPSLGEEDAEAARSPERLPAKFPTPPPRQAASRGEEERTRTSAGGGGGGGAAAAPLTSAADIIRAVAASLEQQLRLMRQLADLEFDAGLVGLMRRRVKALEHELRMTREMYRESAPLATSAEEMVATEAAEAAAAAATALVNPYAGPSGILSVGGDDANDAAAAHARDRNKASLLFAAQRQLELRGRELDALAHSPMDEGIDEALRAQLLRRRDSVVTESEHLARLLAHLAQRMEQVGRHREI